MEAPLCFLPCRWLLISTAVVMLLSSTEASELSSLSSASMKMVVLVVVVMGWRRWSEGALTSVDSMAARLPRANMAAVKRTVYVMICRCVG